MNSIGGYFEMELRKGSEYHYGAIALNTGRNALELILKVKKYKKVFIPYYTCDVIFEPFEKTKIPFEFYSIDNNFEPVFNFSDLKKDEGFLYTNYFALKDSFIKELSGKCKSLIIDNSQAFYSKPVKNVPTFYSCRKFFGVPDGAYLFLAGADITNLPFDVSMDRFSHLIKRIEYGAEVGYDDYKANENSLIGQPILQMSKLTKALLCNIDYNFVRKKRTENFLFLHKKLSKFNEIKIDICKESIPMVYPFLTSSLNLKQMLIENKIFVATYWPNVLNWVNKDSIEYKYASEIIFIPIDQRYTLTEINNIVNLLKTKKNEC